MQVEWRKHSLINKARQINHVCVVFSSFTFLLQNQGDLIESSRADEYWSRA